VLAVTDPQGTAAGRYGVTAGDQPTVVSGVDTRAGEDISAAAFTVRHVAFRASRVGRFTADLAQRSTARGLRDQDSTSPRDAGETIRLGEQVLADCERRLGAEHPDTLTARANLALSYASTGRASEAVALLRQVVADRERPLGAEHPDTLTAQANLALSYRSPERTAEAIGLLQRMLADSEWRDG
jgi:hypothetical protein